MLQQKFIGVTYIANRWLKSSLQIDQCNITLTEKILNVFTADEWFFSPLLHTKKLKTSILISGWHLRYFKVTRFSLLKVYRNLLIDIILEFRGCCRKFLVQVTACNLSFARCAFRFFIDKICHTFSGCPKSDWIEFQGKCYKFSEDKQNWQGARQQCLAQGADLVKIDDKDEDAFLKSHASNDVSTWIGLKRDSAGKFKWTDGTTPR